MHVLHVATCHRQIFSYYILKLGLPCSKIGRLLSVFSKKYYEFLLIVLSFLYLNIVIWFAEEPLFA